MAEISEWNELDNPFKRRQQIKNSSDENVKKALESAKIKAESDTKGRKLMQETILRTKERVHLVKMAGFDANAQALAEKVTRSKWFLFRRLKFWGRRAR